VLKGDFHYQNGFNDILPGEFCYWWNKFNFPDPQAKGVVASVGEPAKELSWT